MGETVRIAREVIDAGVVGVVVLIWRIVLPVIGLLWLAGFL